MLLSFQKWAKESDRFGHGTISADGGPMAPMTMHPDSAIDALYRQWRSLMAVAIGAI
jgi:hypothetical protein